MADFRDRLNIRENFLIDLAKFAVISKLDSGGFGHIYTIENKTTKEKYAAKVLSDNYEEMNRTMINREISIMIRLQHPTIIQFYGYSLQDFRGQDQVTIIMKLAENGSLASVLQKVQNGLADPNYDNTARQKILIGIARGMMHLHQNHVMHRDLKPGNILLDENLHPHITDFGLSKVCINGLSRNQTQSLGTSIYMAPEVIEGERYNGKADVYSFAILMFEVVTDTTPFPLFQKHKMSLFNFNNKVVKENYRPEFTFPVKESIQKLIEKCWSADPNERPTFEEIFNKLAFGIEDSVYDIFEDDDECKFYLDDVDVDEVLTYAYDIVESKSNKICNGSDAEEIKRDNLQLRREIEQIKKDNLQLKEDNKKIASLQEENEKLSKKVDSMKEENEKLSKKVDSMKEENEKLSKKVDSMKEENDKIKDDLESLKRQVEILNRPSSSNSMTGGFDDLFNSRSSGKEEEEVEMAGGFDDLFK